MRTPVRFAATPTGESARFGRSGAVLGGTEGLRLAVAGTILAWYPASTNGATAMFSVAVRGYGIVVWDDGDWRTFAASESLSSILAARVENALDPIAYGYEADVRDALLAMSGAALLAEECDHGAGCCDD